MMKTALQVSLTIVIIILGYFIIESIMEPIRFNKERDVRYDAAIHKLMDIRTAQTVYKTEKGTYTNSFDTLINFLKFDSIEIKFTVGPLDSLLDEGWSKRDAYRSGLVYDVKSYVMVRDSLFHGMALDSLRYVPYADTNQFQMASASVMTASQVEVKVFEAKVHNDVLLHGLNRQLVINFNDEREKIVGFAGLKVGDINEANNNAGNWE